jgi:hypothetical protein
MQVYQEGQRAYRAGTAKAAEEWHADVAVEDRRAPPAEITRAYGHCSITGPAEDVAFILRHLPDAGDA